jgi:hypothetical protein
MPHRVTAERVIGQQPEQSRLRSSSMSSVLFFF